MIKVEVTKNLIALEDMLVGIGTATQIRGGQEVTVTKINASNFPYNGTLTLAEQVALVDTQYNYIKDRLPLIRAAVDMGTMLEYLSVHLDDLALWLTQGDNYLSAFKPFAQRVTQNEVLPANVNFAMLEDTIIEEDVTIELGSNSHIFSIKGEEFIP